MTSQPSFVGDRVIQLLKSAGKSRETLHPDEIALVSMWERTDAAANACIEAETSHQRDGDGIPMVWRPAQLEGGVSQEHEILGDLILSEVGPDDRDPERPTVPPPEPPFDENHALLRKGARVFCSSCIWGDGSHALQKILNVLRDSNRGPQFTDRDNTFIFSENQRRQVLIIDLGKAVSLSRLGIGHSSDRWIDRLSVSTACSWPDFPSLDFFGQSSEEGNTSGLVCWTSPDPLRPSHYAEWMSDDQLFFDSPRGDPVSARFLRIETRSGHYYGAGARILSVFAYGERNGHWTPENSHLYPQNAVTIQNMIRMLRATAGSGNIACKGSHLFSSLPLSLWVKILSYTSFRDWIAS